jgi:hypothetical protein
MIVSKHKREMRKNEIRTGIGLIVGILFCIPSDAVLFPASFYSVNWKVNPKPVEHTMCSDHFIHLCLSAEIKVPSRIVNAIKNKTEQLIREVEIIYDSATESGTEVEQFNSTKPGQDDLSESDTLTGLLPP